MEKSCDLVRDDTRNTEPDEFSRSRDRLAISVLIKLNLFRTFRSAYGLIYFFLPLLLLLSFVVLNFFLIGLIPQTNNLSKYAIVTILPYFISLFSAIGSMGVAYFFSLDRSGGFYEYLIGGRKCTFKAILLSFAISEIIVITVLLSIELAVTFELLLQVAPGMISQEFTLIAVFTIPVSYLSSILMMLALISWTSMSKIYPGVNAPGGLGTIVGVIPSVIFFLLITGSVIPVNHITRYSSLYSIAIMIITLGIFVAVFKRISNERLLS